MEGISYGAASLAGTLKLNKLIVLYDSNDICLDGPLNKVFTEDVKKRFKGLGWNYIRVEDGNDLDEIAEAIEEAQMPKKKPTIIEVKTIIGYGAQTKVQTKFTVSFRTLTALLLQKQTTDGNMAHLKCQKKCNTVSTNY